MESDNKRKIFISGGGGAKDSILLDKEFVKTLKVNKRVLYIPIAIDNSFLTYETCYDWIIKTLGCLSSDFIDIVMWTDLNHKTIGILNNFDALYIGGGNTFKLLQILNDTGFIHLIDQFASRGKILYGGSAGAIILGKSICTVNEENDNEYQYTEGLNLLDGYSVICHYHPALDGRVADYINKYNDPVIALPEKTGLIINNSRAFVCGFEPATIFGLHEEKKSINSGKLFLLKYEK